MHIFYKAIALLQVIVSGGAIALYYLDAGSGIWNLLQENTVYFLLFVAALNFVGLAVDLIARRRRAG
jgi:hypothetical protein